MANNPRSDERTAAGAAQPSTPAAQQATQIAQQATQVAREATRKSAEQAERIVNTAADVNNQTAQVGAEIMHRNTQTLHRAVQSGTEMAATLTERSMQQWNRALGLSGNEAEKAVEQSSKTSTQFYNRILLLRIRRSASHESGSTLLASERSTT